MLAKIEKFALLKAVFDLSGDSLQRQLSATSKAFVAKCADLFILTPKGVASIIALLTPEVPFCLTGRIPI